MKQDRPKISDVARVAGVSTATVSRALSSPERVSPETLALVQDAVTKTGYRLNMAARNLRRQRTGGIVALVPNLANPFFSQILSGIASVLGPAGYNLLVTDTETAQIEGLLAYAEPSRADGLIVLDGRLPAEGLRDRVPMVLACEWIKGLEHVPRVKIDNRAAAALAIAHLLSLGHRRIGYVAGPFENVLAEARFAGTRDALEAQGRPFDPNAYYQGNFTLDSGRDAAEVWLSQPVETRPTALFIASDEMACGFIGEVQRRGISVPHDLSVVGIDDIELVSHVSPPLTTIRQPRSEIGRKAAERLLAILEGNEPEDAPRDLILPVELVLRESTAPAKV